MGAPPPEKEAKKLARLPTRTSEGTGSGDVRLNEIVRSAPVPVRLPPRAGEPPAKRTVTVPLVICLAVKKVLLTPPAVGCFDFRNLFSVACVG